MSIRVKLRYIHREDSRHGTVRYYCRRKVGDKRVRMREQPGTEAFLIQYGELLRTATGAEITPKN